MIKKINLPRWTLWVLGGVAVVSFIFFLLVCLLNEPVADDYSYFAKLQDGGVFGFLDYHYAEHSGRFGQGVLVALSWGIFGVQSVKIMPFVMLLVLGIGVSWLVWRLLPMTRKDKKTCVVIGFATTAAAMIGMLSFYDSVLWWTASSIYLGSLIAMVFSVVFTHIILTRKVAAWQFTIMLALIIFGQGFSEIASVLMGLGGIALGVVLIVKKRWAMVWRLLAIGGAIAVGFALVYFSGGSTHRRTADAIGQWTSWSHLLYVMPKWFGQIFLSNYHWWQAVLLVAGRGACSVFFRAISLRKTLLMSVAIICITGFATYVVLVFNSYIGWMDLRAYTACCFIVGVGGILVSALLVNYFGRKKALATACVVTAAFVIAVPGVLRDNVDRMQGQALREYYFDRREESVARQLESGARRVVVEMVPVLAPEKTGASDVGDKPEQQSWVVPAFRRYYGIPDSLELVVEKAPYDVRHAGSY